MPYDDEQTPVGREERLDVLARAMRHDFHAVARGISTCGQWLEELWPGIMPDDARESFDLVKERAHRLRSLVEGAVEFATAGADDSPPGATVSANVCVDAALADRPTRDIKRVTVLPNMPEVASIGPSALTRVFFHLIDNALKYTPAESPVYVAGAVDGDIARYTVCDEGPGIPEDQRDWAFRLFTRLGAPDDGSAGVGLTVCQTIVEEHGGSIGIEANEVGGVVVWFSLPSKPQSAD